MGLGLGEGKEMTRKNKRGHWSVGAGCRGQELITVRHWSSLGQDTGAPGAGEH